MASSSSSSPLEDLETQLEMSVENLRQINIIVADFQPQGQNVLNQKMFVQIFLNTQVICMYRAILLT